MPPSSAPTIDPVVSTAFTTRPISVFVKPDVEQERGEELQRECVADLVEDDEHDERDHAGHAEQLAQRNDHRVRERRQRLAARIVGLGRPDRRERHAAAIATASVRNAARQLDVVGDDERDGQRAVGQRAIAEIGGGGRESALRAAARRRCGTHR